MTDASHSAGDPRFHVSLSVTDLDRAVAFYGAVFEHAPAKRRSGYAKFEVEAPPVVLSLETGMHAGRRGAVGHMGLRLTDGDALAALQARLESAGIECVPEEGVECCYSRQTKFWLRDPDANLWEFYVLEEDLDHRGDGQSAIDVLEAPQPVAPAPSTATEANVLEHRFRQPLPVATGRDAASVDEVLLAGTFNGAIEAGERTALLAELHRVLAPGGRVIAHVLTAEAPLPAGARPDGAAAAVEAVPVDAELVATFEDAGFSDVNLKTFGETPCYRVADVECRQTRLEAVRPADPAAAGEPRTVVYRGPFRQVTDDLGRTYRRGARQQVPAEVWRSIETGSLASSFSILAPRAQ